MGQFGSLYDQMNWSARNHNLSAAVNYELTRKLSLYASLVWNRGRGSFDGIGLDISKVPAIPAGFNYAAVSEIGRYSALNADRHQDIVGLQYQLSERWSLNGTLFHAKYKDKSPYLLDATGRSSGAEAGLTYSF